MSKKRIIIPEKQLYHLYFKKKLSFSKIAKLIRISHPTVVSRFREYGFKARKYGEWLTKYKKENFSGNDEEKAYIMGFFVGDLNAYKPSKNSDIIVVRCHSTQISQLHLVKSLFNKYGHVTISESKTTNNRPSFHINCYLNNSFSFLLIKKPYRIEDWIVKKNKNCISFIAGYIDAEGNFILNQNRARFKIDSYDFSILSWMHNWCKKHKIISKFKLLAKRGSLRYDKIYRWNNDLWRLNINEANALLKFCRTILPFLKHRKRIKDVKKCVLNIIKRRRNGTIKS
ncbi:hypothetical protein COS61_02335 [Candidatus Wolfebacteria bacterium CG03_land_8_20_14_0_80_40_12]|uniref:Homing endonuclease LAGLIDADG domain-containing protein n=1 Tax=Candidatus Wolfebacteria bacterium CG03_land_8_20_14_0_80_40_12 TaxID=1975069 RepID=A0A2M7B559_9BACT|nr:MAG: hypothetical protein COS61_02335 [Candidatus Wolfebacteria bacterium CG03_land_8_20_14_0_80_40_12]